MSEPTILIGTSHWPQVVHFLYSSISTSFASLERAGLGPNNPLLNVLLWTYHPYIGPIVPPFHQQIFDMFTGKPIIDFINLLETSKKRTIFFEGPLLSLSQAAKNMDIFTRRLSWLGTLSKFHHAQTGSAACNRSASASASLIDSQVKSSIHVERQECSQIHQKHA